MRTAKEINDESIVLLTKKLATLKEMKAEIEESIARTENTIKMIQEIYNVDQTFTFWQTKT